MPIVRVNGNQSSIKDDILTAEEPLEIILGCNDGEHGHGSMRKTLAITMRTPHSLDEDRELAAGFLFAESIIAGVQDIAAIWHYEPDELLAGAMDVRNSIHVQLRDGVHVDWKRLERHSYTTSSCGVCGKASMEALEIAGCEVLPFGAPVLMPDVLYGLPQKLRKAQDAFAQTGGIHAAALFDAEGSLLLVREDVGRHNALDKLIGAELLAGNLPLMNKILILSGRVSFELVQKALRAKIPVIASVGAPSSMAVQTAERFGVTLIGFLRDGRFNVYSGKERLQC